MLRRDRIPPSLLLAICRAAAWTAGAQEPTASTPPTPPTPPPSQPMQQPAVPATAQPAPPESAVAPPPPPATPATPAGAPAQPPPATPAAPGRPLRPGQPAAPPRPPISPDLLQFQLKFPAAKGGGSASGAAASLEYKREDYAVLTGSVYVHYQDVDLQADQAEIDLSTKDVIALGNVVIDQGPRRMTGRSATFNLGTKTGKVKEATAFVSPDYFFSGTELDTTGDSSYDVDHVIFT